MPEPLRLVPIIKDGRDGRDGRDADPTVIRAEVARAVGRLPLQKGDIGLHGPKGDKGDKGDPGEQGEPGADAPPRTIRSVNLALIRGDSGRIEAGISELFVYSVTYDPDTGLPAQISATPI